MTGIEVRQIVSRAGANDFIAAAVVAQKGNAHWVRPLDIETRLFFSPRFSPFAKQNEIARFVAYRDGEPVGRVAAIHDTEHLKRHHDETGHFGFIEAVDDAAVFAALMTHAEFWLASRGLTRILGPFSGSINHEVGLLVEGFDAPHIIKTNHSPVYYAGHLERLGYRKAMDLHAYAVKPQDAQDWVTRTRRVIARRSADGLTFRKLTYRDWKSSFLQLLALYNETWMENWNAVPLSGEEAAALADAMLPFVKPGWIEVAEYRGEPVALLALIPDANEALAGLRGRLLPFGWAKLLWGLHVAGTRRARVPLAGVAPRWRATHIGSRAIVELLINALERAGAGGIDMIEFSWVLETNRPAIGGIGLTSATLSRTFRVFEKDIGSTRV